MYCMCVHVCVFASEYVYFSRGNINVSEFEINGWRKWKNVSIYIDLYIESVSSAYNMQIAPSWFDSNDSHLKGEHVYNMGGFSPIAALASPLCPSDWSDSSQEEETESWVGDVVQLAPAHLEFILGMLYSSEDPPPTQYCWCFIFIRIWVKSLTQQLSSLGYVWGLDCPSQQFHFSLLPSTIFYPSFSLYLDRRKPVHKVPCIPHYPVCN